MKKLLIAVFLLSFVAISTIWGQKGTGYLDDFNSATLNAGWIENSQYILEATGTSMLININKSQPWRSFYLDLGGVQDFSASPFVNVKARGNIAYILHVYFLDINGNNILTEAKVHQTGDFVNLFFDLTPPPTTEFDITQVQGLIFAMNGAAVSLEGTAWFDDLRIGDQAIKMAAIGGFADQVVPANSTNNKILVTDIQNAQSLSLTGTDGFITNIEISPISDGVATITYDCIADATGLVTPTLIITGNTGYENNEFAFSLELEPNHPPVIDQMADIQIEAGTSTQVRFTGINDGNISYDQPLSITATSSNPSVVDPTAQSIAYSEGSPYAMMEIATLQAGSTTITITVDDLEETDNSTSMEFVVTAYADFNNPPVVDEPLAQEVFTGSGTQVITLSGIGDGDNSDQQLTFTATPANTEIISSAQIIYTQGEDTALLEYIPAASGITHITIELADNGGTIENNGDAYTTFELKVEVRQAAITGFTIPMVDLQADMEANLWNIETEGIAQTIEYVSFDGFDDVLQINCTAKNTWTGLWYRHPELDLTNHPYIVCDVYSVDNQIDFHTYLWDNKGNRNTSGAHEQRKTIQPNTWTKVILDYRGAGLLEDDNGEPINIERIDSILLNYHDGFGWPFHEYSGVLYIKDFKIGSDAATEVPVLTPDATINLVADRVLPTNAGAQQILLTGISNGNSSAENITLEAQSSNLSLIPIPTISPVSPDGTATLSFTPAGTTGSSNITITVNAEGSNSKSITFNITILNPDPSVAENIEIDLQTSYQTMKGFGTFSNSESLLNLYVNEMGATAIRIGLIGNQIEPVNDNNDPYVLNREALNYSALNFDYYRKLKEAGVETFILTSWSPPAWMKDNLSDNFQNAGVETNCDNTDNKLSYHYYEEFAESMVAVVRMFEEEAGITLAAIGLQNEPVFHEPYASAILDLTRFPELIKVVGQRFEMEGITTQLFMPEQVFSQGANSMHEYINFLQANAEADPYCSIIATHGYADDGIQPGSPNYAEWESMWDNAQEGSNPKELWMTETFREYISWDDAIGFAGAIHGALTAGNVNLWTSWAFEGMQAFRGKATPMLYTSANYFRFIRPGAVRLGAVSSDEDLLVSAFETADDSMAKVIVIINKSAEPKTVSITGDGVPVAYQVWQTSENQNLENMGIWAEKTILLPASSVSTMREVEYNRTPTVAQVENFSILEESGSQQLTLTGISDGGDPEPQTITLTAESSDPSVIGNIDIDYTSPSETATLNYTVAGTVGQTAVIMVTIQDDGGTPNGSTGQTTMSFTITLDTEFDVINPELSATEIYPNPVHDQLNIRLGEEIKQYSIFDLSGKVILNKMHESGAEIITIDTGWMENGVYFIELTSKTNQLKRYKFVKE